MLRSAYGHQTSHMADPGLAPESSGSTAFCKPHFCPLHPLLPDLRSQHRAFMRLLCPSERPSYITAPLKGPVYITNNQKHVRDHLMVTSFLFKKKRLSSVTCQGHVTKECQSHLCHPATPPLTAWEFRARNVPRKTNSRGLINSPTPKAQREVFYETRCLLYLSSPNGFHISCSDVTRNSVMLP